MQSLEFYFIELAWIFFFSNIMDRHVNDFKSGQVLSTPKVMNYIHCPLKKEKCLMHSAAEVSQASN
jgi:hypothetical protein